MQEVLEAKDGVKVMETKIVEYSATAAGLADLQHRFKDVVFDVTTTKGMTDAKAARYELVKLRSGLEAKRKEIKAPALERSRLIDAEANKINVAIAALEIPFDDAIKVEEKRKETEKQAKIDAEVARVADIRATISSMAAVAVRAVGRPSAEVEAKIRLVVALVTDEKKAEFAEFFAEATAVQVDTLLKLRELHAAAMKAEADAAELEQLRAAEASRKREEEARAAAARKEEDARQARAREQLEADELAARAARKKADDEAAAARAEADRIAREKREAEQRQADAERAAQRREQEEADRIDRAAREAEERRIAEARAKLQAEQDERDAAEREHREAEAIEEGRRREEAAAAEDRLKGAAQSMLDALLLWRLVDGARMARTTDGYKDAARAREDAIFAATGKPSGT